MFNNAKQQTYLTEIKEGLSEQVFFLIEWDVEKRNTLFDSFKTKISLTNEEDPSVIRVSLKTLRKGLNALAPVIRSQGKPNYHEMAHAQVKAVDSIIHAIALEALKGIGDLNSDTSVISEEAYRKMCTNIHTRENYHDFIVIGPCPWDGSHHEADEPIQVGRS